MRQGPSVLARPSHVRETAGRARCAAMLAGAAFCLIGAGLIGVAMPTQGVAQTYLDGRTLQQAPDFIIKRYEAKAAAGDARAQFFLGLMNEQGLIGDAPDDAAARQWFKTAANAGYPPAHYKLAVFLEEGRGGLKDMKGAVRHYQAAAKAGLSEAQYNAGLMLAEGRGVARDVRAGIRWLEQAALAGVVSAQFSLAELYSAGVGIPVDLVEAWAWLRRAAEAGDTGQAGDASRLLALLEKRMDADERAEALALKAAHDSLATIQREQ